MRLDWGEIYTSDRSRFLNRGLAEAILSAESELAPRMSWLVRVGEALHLSETATLNAAWWCLLLAGVFLLAGACCRSSALAAWLLHLCAVKSGSLMSYGMDNFTTIGLFYLLISPLPDRFAFDAIFRGYRPKDARYNGYIRRILQLHLCVIYFCGGLTKALGPDWWNGESIWRSVTRSPFNVISPAFWSFWGEILPFAGVGVLFLELTYPVFIWPSKTRPFWLAGIVAMHLGIAVAMGLHLFALIMVVLNLAAFGALPRALRNFRARPPTPES